MKKITNLSDESSTPSETFFSPRDVNYLYEGSNLKIREFNTLFFATVDKIAIAENQREMVLDLRLLLPIKNNLPSSYYKKHN